MTPSPFDLADDETYRRWRDLKLSRAPASISELVVEVRDPASPSPAEHAALLDRCRRANMAIYVGATGDDPSPEIPVGLGKAFGLHRLDRNWLGDDTGLTSLRVQDLGTRRHYIPYTNHPIRWHTDGYYNTPETRINGLILHCVRPAAEGGDNALMDHELAYIALREQAPELVRALMEPDAMTIPPRLDETDAGVARAEQSGPVFSVGTDGNLHMRFTERKRNIVWKETPDVQAAVTALGALFATSPLAFRARLESGMGLLCNNCLHDRSAFLDDPQHPRLLYRGRYYDRIAGTGWQLL